MAHSLSQSYTATISDIDELCVSNEDDYQINDETSDAETPVFSDNEILSDDDDDFHDNNLSLTDMLSDLLCIEQDLFLSDNGYKIKKKAKGTMQGEIFNGLNQQNELVVIKRSERKLVQTHMSLPDEDGMEYYVDEDILKEAKITQYLSSFDHPSMCKFIDFLASDQDYFLISEGIENGMNFKEFVNKAHEYIKVGKLLKAEYHSILKSVFWQLAAALYWLHNVIKCCHLKICSENVILEEMEFIENGDNSITINPQFTVKLIDYSNAEVFEDKNVQFNCSKFQMYENTEALTPKIQQEEVYDARAADCWAFGMMLFYAMTNESASDVLEINEYEITTWSDVTVDVNSYIESRGLGKYFCADSGSLIRQLIINEKERISINKVLKHAWFEQDHQMCQETMYSILKMKIQKVKQMKQKTADLPRYVFL